MRQFNAAPDPAPEPDRSRRLRLSATAARRLPLAAALAIAVAGATAATATAAVTITSSGGSTVTLSSDTAGDTITLECVGGEALAGGVDAHLPCTAVTTLFIDGNGGNDAIDIANVTAADFPNLAAILIDGGDGTDVITGGALPETVTADSLDVVSTGGGDDQIVGGAQVAAGPGDDSIASPFGSADGGPGDDHFTGLGSGGPLTGGDGEDEFAEDLAAVSGDVDVTLDDAGITAAAGNTPAFHAAWGSIERVVISLGPGRQTVDGSGFTGSLQLDGGPGDDRLVGGNGEDSLFGSSGNDELVGGPGFDYVSGGAGDDTLQLRDGVADRGLCGDGTDTVTADAVDLLAGCEAVDLPTMPLGSPGPTTLPPSPVTPPVAKLLLAKARLSGARLSFTAACPAADGHCRGSATLKVTGKRGRKAASQALGKVTLSLTGGKTATLAKKLTAKQLAALRRLRFTRLTIALNVSDDAHASAKQAVSLSLRVPPKSSKPHRRH